MSKSVGNVATIQDVIARVGAGGGAALPDDGALAQAARVLGGDDDGRRRAGREPAQRAPRRDAGRRRLGRARRRRSTTTSTPRPRSRSSTAGPARERSTSCGEGSPSSGSARSATPSRRPAEIVALARARAEARAARDFAESDRLRDEIAAAGWEVRDATRARRLRARAALVTRELVYGRNAVREALRGRREVLELWVSERAAASLDWLGEGPRPQVVKERELTEAAGEPGSPGRRRLGEPVSLRGSLGARRRRDAPARVPRPGHRPPKPRRRRSAPRPAQARQA